MRFWRSKPDEEPSPILRAVLDAKKTNDNLIRVLQQKLEDEQKQ